MYCDSFNLDCNCYRLGIPLLENRITQLLDGTMFAAHQIRYTKPSLIRVEAPGAEDVLVIMFGFGSINSSLMFEVFLCEAGYVRIRAKL